MNWLLFLILFLILGLLPMLSKAARELFPGAAYPELVLLFSAFLIVLLIALVASTASMLEFLIGLFFITSLCLIGYCMAIVFTCRRPD